jgi:hypothetical protein
MCQGSLAHARRNAVASDSYVRAIQDLTAPDSERADADPFPGSLPPPAHSDEEDSQATVYQALAVHQRCEAWGHRELLSLLQEWAVRFAVEFELDVPELALRVDVLPRSYLGHFRPGHNGFGLRGEIALNATYLRQLSVWEVLGVLLHEMIHAWQYAHGSPSDGNHHNGEFRRKAAAFGLNIGRRGVTGYDAVSRFRDLLRRFRIDMPEGDMPPRERRVKGSSKNKKWTCGCPVSVRCAVTLHARCLRCGQDFRLAEGEPSGRGISRVGR